MKPFFSFIILLLCYSALHGQNKEGNIWHFGRNAGLDFNNSPPTPLLGSSLNTWEGCASIADPDGNLLFYTDGINVWDVTHNRMPNGYGMTGDPSSTQSGVIVPKPGAPDIYYIFTVDARIGRLDYSVVDMSLNGGLGDIVTKNTPLLSLSTEKISAVVHQNRQDIWVLGHEWNSDQFYAWLVTDQGVSATPVVTSAGSVHSGTGEESIGYLKFSSNNETVAIAGFGRLDFVEVFDFDNSSGRLTFQNSYTGFGANGPYGLEFSPNDQYLYISERVGTTALYQLALGTPSGDISTAATRLITDQNFGALQLATDGKIYLARDERDYLGIIHNPDAAAPDVNLELNGVYLGGPQSSLGLPTFIQSFFRSPQFEVSSVCFGDVTTFEIEAGFLSDIDSVAWTFGDPSSGIDNTSEEFSPTHIFTATGDFEVGLIAYIDGLAITSTETITIFPLPEVDLGPDYVLSRGEALDISLSSDLEYVWLDSETVTERTLESPGWYWARGTNSNNCTEIDSIAIFRLTYSDTCRLDNTAFMLEAGNINIDSVNWVFGDAGSGTFNSASGTNPTHQFSSSGPFNVSTDIYFNGNALSYSRTVNVNPLPDSGLPESETLINDKDKELSIDNLEVAWDNGSSSPTRTFEEPGWYWADVVNTNQCMARDSLAVFSIDYANTCFTSNTQMVLSSGNIAIDSVRWNFDDTGSGATNTSSEVNPTHIFSAPGVYEVSCDIFFQQKTSRSAFEVTIEPLPEVNLGADQTLFYGETLLLNAPGTAISYSWQDGSAADNFLVTEPGIYWVDVTNSSGCLQRDSVVIDYDQVIDVSLASDTLLCLGETLLLDISLPDASYRWQDGSTNPDYTVTNQGTYWVEITNAFGNRTKTDSIRVDYYEFSEIETEREVVICFDQAVNLIASGATGNETYRWYDEDLNLIEENEGTYTTPILTASADYFVSLQAGRCESEVTRISIIHDQVIAEIIPSDTIVAVGNPVILDGYGGDTFEWSPSIWLNSTNSRSVTALPQDDIEYTLITASNRGCMDEERILLLVEKEINVPNVITPNGDGFNDLWKIENIERFPLSKIRLFDRQGNFIRQFDNYLNTWDGTKNGTALPAGTYFYIIDLGGENHSLRKGSISIIR